MTINVINTTDAYKVTHWNQYPKGTTKVVSYLESRLDNTTTMFFGLQQILKQIEGVVITHKTIDKFVKESIDVFGYDYVNVEGWRRIVDVHDGKLPIRIKAVPEGTVLGTRNVLMTIENTDPELPWLTNYIESLLLQVWYPITIATETYKFKEFCKYVYDSNVLPVLLNDFGVRGSTSPESASIGGMAHLVNFMGTDNLPAIAMARKVYGATGPVGLSVIAMEHSTVTSFGKEFESDAYRQTLEAAPDDAIVSIVSDSYDIKNAVYNIFGGELKDLIINRTGRTVIRPDSGDQLEMSIDVITWLDEVFGSTIDKETGLKILNHNVGVIYADGMTFKMMKNIIINLIANEYSPNNIIFGMGGMLLQGFTRDTYRMAIKCCAIEVDGQMIDMYKRPTTDMGKASKSGIPKLIYDETYKTVREDDAQYDKFPNILTTVFENGKIVKEYTWDEVKQNAEV